MDLKGIDIRIVGAGRPVRTDAVVMSSAKGRVKARYHLSETVDTATSASVEATLRRSCAAALVKAHMLRARSLAVGALGFGPRLFPPLAVAKIIAQEIYRYARDVRFAPRTLKRIEVVAPSRKLMPVYEKGIFGYLRHVVSALEGGPFVTVDIIIEMKGGIVLVRRSNPPFGWALPGGFVDHGESLEEAAWREAKEETGLDVKGLKQFHTYSRPGRDPRFQTISTVFVGHASGTPRAASDAAAVRVVNSRQGRALELAFDHRKILDDYCRRRPA